MSLDTDKFEAVSISYASQPHDPDKRLLYNLSWAEDLGISHVEKASTKICKAILTNVMSQESSVSSKPLQRQVPFKRICVPADGMCGWYALLASENVGSWEKIPRNEGGYPLNKKVHEKEIERANTLHSSVCAQALKTCHESYHSAIRTVQGNPCFPPSDLEWIAHALSLSIRCTCDPKARCCQISMGMGTLRTSCTYIIYVRQWRPSTL